nr:hypothetical protein BaRGS_004131 [Batillaria attramentaria]
MIELGTPKWQEEEERPMPHPVTDPDLDLNPSLIYYQGSSTAPVDVILSNLSTHTVVVNPKSVLCEVQPVDVTALDDTATEDQKPSLLSVVDVHSDILSSDQEEKVKELITEFQDTFAMSEEEVGLTSQVKHRIDLEDDRPFKQAHRRIPPAMIDEVRSHLQQLLASGYYRRMVKDFSKIAAPLTVLMPTPAKKQRGKRSQASTKPWNWGLEEECAFQRLKEILSSPPILGYADYDRPFQLHTDASQQGLGAILYQEQEGHQRVIAYASRSLSKAERNYPAHKLEFLALKWAVCEKFKDYLYGAEFVVFTDNNPLTYVLSTAKLDATGHRWLAALAAFKFSIRYKPGINNTDADTLSRMPTARDAARSEISPSQCKPSASLTTCV